jgi:hypothetical protein
MRLINVFRSKTENSPNINQDDQGKSILPITAISMRHAIIESKFNKAVVKRMISGVLRLRPEFQESRSWYLLYDNAPALSSGVVSELLAKRGILVLSPCTLLP